MPSIPRTTFVLPVALSALTYTVQRGTKCQANQHLPATEFRNLLRRLSKK